MCQAKKLEYFNKKSGRGEIAKAESDAEEENKRD